MGDWYEFDFILVDGEHVAGAVFQNKDSNYNQRQIQLTEDQKELVNEWLEKQDSLNGEREALIKSFISSPESYKVTQVQSN